MKTSNTKIKVDDASFRDPSGFVFTNNKVVYRQVNLECKDEFDGLMKSGLYKSLTKKGWLIEHRAAAKSLALSGDVYKVIKPAKIPFVSYPYEWSFSQLKSAAVLTLKIQLEALRFGMGLKDASAYNVQFVGAKPVFIDTLSFENYEPGKPWVAYRQFCKHFLGPLALMSQVDLQLSKLLVTNLDGVDLGLVSKLLPKKTWLRFGLVSHVHMNAKSQSTFSDKTGSVGLKKLDKSKLVNLVKHLLSVVESMEFEDKTTEWSDYYDNTNYSKRAFQAKKKLVLRFMKQAKPKKVLELGANTGEFSKLAEELGAYTLSTDFDVMAVERQVRNLKKGSNKTLPLVVDVLNPSPAIGWGSVERKSFVERANADVVTALALVHHLGISGNVGFEKMAEGFSELGKYLIVEFVGREDSQVAKLLSHRDDDVEAYSEASFESGFKTRYKVLHKRKIAGTKRTLYLMKGK